jgi:hypothetical protein
MTNKIVRLWIITLAFSFASARTEAASVRMNSVAPEYSIATIEGKIERGDAATIQTFLGTNKPTRLYLASPGGNLIEAMRIGLMIRRLNLSTIVPSKPLTNQDYRIALTKYGLSNPRIDYLCGSACFFVFVAGVHRSADEMKPPLLGIHRPFIPGNDVVALAKNNEIDAAVGLENVIRDYSIKMDVPEKYVENMFSTPKAKLLWIRNDEFNQDFEGFIPRLKQWAQTECGPDLTKSKDVCEQRLQDELAIRSYRDALPKGALSFPQDAR